MAFQIVRLKNHDPGCEIVGRRMSAPARIRRTAGIQDDEMIPTGSSEGIVSLDDSY
jgi:hypothetical protein